MSRSLGIGPQALTPSSAIFQRAVMEVASPGNRQLMPTMAMGSTLSAIVGPVLNEMNLTGGKAMVSQVMDEIAWLLRKGGLLG
jgi:hypothetical protein